MVHSEEPKDEGPQLARPKKLFAGKSGIRYVSLDLEESTFTLPEPLWLADEKAQHCGKCKVRFHLLRRRHHCRRCGEVFCHMCSHVKFPLSRMGFAEDVRHCGDCLEISKAEDEFFTQHLVALEKGGYFFLRHSDTTVNSCVAFHVSISPNHRWISLDSGCTESLVPNARCDPVSLTRIISIEVVMKQHRSYPGTLRAPGMIVRHYDKLGVQRDLLLQSALAPNLKQSLAWLMALQAACKMLSQPTMPSRFNS